MRQLRKFFALTAINQKELLLAVWWLPAMHFRLKRQGLNACLASLEKKGFGVAEREELDAAERRRQALECERNVAAVARYGLVSGTCLSRSLTVLRLMTGRRIAGRLRLGVDLEGGELKAHAWVEVDGVCLSAGNQNFKTFPIA